VVVSLEYGDGSQPRTFINLPKDDPNIESGKVDSTPQDRARGYSRTDYVFPQHNARDAMPGNKQGIDKELLSAQI